MRVINKHYSHSVKGILSEPTRRFPHTRVSSMYPLITYNRGNKTLSTQLYLARLTRQKENKRLQGYTRLIWLVGYCICGSITKRASLYSIFISSHHYFINLPFYVNTYATFKQVVSSQNHFTIFHIPVLTTVLDHSQVVPSHKNGGS